MVGLGIFWLENDILVGGFAYGSDERVGGKCEEVIEVAIFLK